MTARRTWDAADHAAASRDRNEQRHRDNPAPVIAHHTSGVVRPPDLTRPVTDPARLRDYGDAMRRAWLNTPTRSIPGDTADHNSPPRTPYPRCLTALR